ncbi:MAG TPA: helix-turn-helix domain-containing protein [Gemmatimonadaceae bacterium]|nr:helix-turn-helix domain-containing protein [Gemmatimonadaceae bacterium]
MPENPRSTKSSVADRTRGRLLTLLREGSWTVDDLADQLGLTDNAVRFHLDALEKAGSVEKSGVRRLGVGQPAVLYSLSASAEEAFSRAYAPLLVATLAELRERMTPGELMRLLKRIGKRLARGAGQHTGSVGTRTARASELLNELGGVTVVEKRADGYTIVGRACPLARAVKEDHCVCAAVTSLVADVVGAEVTERCDRSGRPQCRFDIKPGTSTRTIAHA